MKFKLLNNSLISQSRGYFLFINN
ncbi:hypothetical protein EQ808_05685 [Staphylococcus hominis]|nr:hypothetical protein EQ808_05685 [Staphylococcus hominis]